MKYLVQRWNHFWFEPTSADNLGLCRIILYGSMFLFYVLSPMLFRSWGWPEDFTLWGSVSKVFWRPVWFLAMLHLPPLSTTSLIAVQFLWRLALALSCLGLFTRLSTAASFVFGVYLMGTPNSFGRTHHLDILLVWAFLVMAFSRCGDAWAVDALIRKARARTVAAESEPVKSGEYTWPIHLIWVISAMIYLESGMSKLRHSGIRWVTTNTMQNYLLQAYYHLPDSEPLTTWGLFFARFHWLSSALAAGALLAEIGFVIALFSRRARWVLVPGVVAMQSGIALLLGPNFYQMIMCQATLWVPWNRVIESLTERYVGSPTYAVAFDGACGLCRRTVAVLRSLDVLRRIEFLDIVHQWPQVEKKFGNSDRNFCLAEMRVRTTHGQIKGGFYAYRALAWALPLGWLVIPLLYVPGVPWAGSYIYNLVATRRYRGTCSVPQPEAITESRLPHVQKATKSQ